MYLKCENCSQYITLSASLHNIQFHFPCTTICIIIYSEECVCWLLEHFGFLYTFSSRESCKDDVRDSLKIYNNVKHFALIEKKKNSNSKSISVS